jgi:hypothetical protein
MTVELTIAAGLQIIPGVSVSLTLSLQRVIILLLSILTANGFSPGGSDTTIRHNIQTTHITQNNTTIKRNTAHKTTHTINT